MVCQQRRASGRRMRLEPRGRATSSTDRSEKARENRPDTPPGSARDEPKSSKNGAGTPPGRSWSIRGATGTFQRRSGATPERSWGAPGASQSGPGAFPVRPRTSRDSPRKVPSVPRTPFADARREHGVPNGCPSGFSWKSLGESRARRDPVRVPSRSNFRSFLDRFSSEFSLHFDIALRTCA